MTKYCEFDQIHDNNEHYTVSITVWSNFMVLVRPKVCRCHDERLFYLDHLILHLELHCSSFAMWGAAVLIEWLSHGQYFSYSTKYCSFKAVSDIISTFIENDIFFGHVLSGLSISKVHHCHNFFVIFSSIFGRIYSVMWINLNLKLTQRLINKIKIIFTGGWW